jgi:two-component system, chemotaxis family, CheB/CheR fusion protein
VAGQGGSDVTTSASAPTPSVPVCGIGASAGAVEALRAFFSAVPIDLGLAYVVIVHLAPDRKSELPGILGRSTPMPVTQVGDHDKIELQPNHVYVIAPDRKLEITDTSVGASSFEQPRGQRAAIDLFFRSLAERHGDGFAVVLSGTGSDGAVGAKAIKEGGGVVLVQDPNEALHGDMPRAAIATGVADLVLPIRELTARLSEMARNKHRIIPMVRAATEAGSMPPDEAEALEAILGLLRQRTGHDFSKYKRTTILRRLSRRLQLAHRSTIAEYLKYLRAHEPEVKALFDDFLISVTTFFRDPEAWAALQAKVVGPLVERTEANEQIRAWVAGCATGEEAYSLAILFHEEFERQRVRGNLIIFASDVDEGALAVARQGLYPRAIGADVSEPRLERYFTAEDEYYRVVRRVRDDLVFATHSLLRDAPFPRLHLISCRNLLIYLDRDLQEQAMSVFRYACRDGAHLFLGAAEMADQELFRPVDAKHRIFLAQPKSEAGQPSILDIFAAPIARGGRHARELRQPTKSTGADIHLSALEEVAPPTVLVDERGHVLHLSPSVSRYFQQGGGPLARRVTDLVRPELRNELHGLLQRALDSFAPQLSPFVAVALHGGSHRVALLAQQRAHSDEERRDVLITFLDAGEMPVDAPPAEGDSGHDLVRSLREKLRQAEQRIDTMRDDHSLADEDRRAANEELQSLNEEYRSTTEELETSKEELQSINEELHTVNQELKLKLDEVSRAHSDLENLMAATNVATLFLDPDLRIKRFTPQLADVFNVKSRDLERPIGDLTHTLDYDTLEGDARAVVTRATSVERLATSRDGRIYVTRLSPYLKAGGQEPAGVVITFIDVTAIKQAESARRESERKLEAELNVMRRLHRMTVSLAASPTMTEALEHVLATAIELHSADCGLVQLIGSDGQHLRIAAQQGFDAPFLERFRFVGPDDGLACGRALRQREIVQVPDVMTDDGYASYSGVAVEAGYRAVQSSPLLDRDGHMVGVLSVHFHEPHEFSERDRQLGDVLGQQAAGVIAERAQQEKLRRLNEALNARTKELEASHGELSRHAADLLQHDRHREEFLAALGHELRNPMAAMQSALTLVSASDERAGRALAVLRRQTAHMRRLIDDLLDITRVKHGRLRLQRETVDVSQVALAALEAVHQQAASKGLRLEHDLPDSPLLIRADPERLAQVLDNLLRNAVAYTNAGFVSLSVRAEPDRARVIVRDTGVGIHPADIPALFEPYQQPRDSSRSEGLGLGLTLVKALVEAHGGTIACRSEGPGRGSEFTFTIPRATSDIEPPPSPRQAPPPARVRVLVVDDQRDVADMLAYVLQILGQDVRVAYSAASAVTIAREHRPHLALLDVSMPGRSGSALASDLRQEFPANELTLVAVTGHDRRHPDVVGGDFDHHLLKPVTEDDLIALLNGLHSGREP